MRKSHARANSTKIGRKQHECKYLLVFQNAIRVHLLFHSFKGKNALLKFTVIDLNNFCENRFMHTCILSNHSYPIGNQFGIIKFRIKSAQHIAPNSKVIWQT